MKDSRLEPVTSWDDVFNCVARISADPWGNIDLIKVLTVNLRVETGSLPGYKGSGFSEKADSIAMSKQMREKLEALMSIDLSSDEMYLLVRQLLKSLPFFGASQDEIRTIRWLAEEIEHSFPCPITEDIREEVHSKLSPRNLDLVRSLLIYAETGESDSLRDINKYQKVFRYRPEEFEGILRPLIELERELANVFEPHPGRIEDRIDNIYQVMRDISQIVSPKINTYLGYLLESIQKNNKSHIQTNRRVLFSLLREAIDTAENPNFKALFENLTERLRESENRGPEEVLSLIAQWNRDAASLFLPSLVDSLERFISYVRTPDALKAALMLGDLRMSLRRRIKDPLLQQQTMAVMLESIWLDLTLERIGYILFGEVNSIILADITNEMLHVAIDVIHSMVLSVRARGQGSRRLEEYSDELTAFKRSKELNFYTVYSVVERIGAEIGAITDNVVATYYEITRDIFVSRQITRAEEAASAFVDGLFRETTLQHLSELTLQLLNFSRAQIASLLKRMRHPPIREISPRKVANIERDLETVTEKVDPSQLAYFFQPGNAEGRADYYPILGEKGAFLAEMSRLGLNVPPGFTLTTTACNMFYSDGHILRNRTQEIIFRYLGKLEDITGHRLGFPERPLLLAVRAGSCVSMPGMMDTILNIGLNNETVEGLSRITGDPLFAYECYFRLITKYSFSVMGIADSEAAGLGEAEVPCSSSVQMKERVTRLLESVLAITGNEFPQDPREQLIRALEAIFSSWQSESAITYRQIFNIPHHFGTAATIQKMVFGNRGPGSCSGVLFSRNPITGERRLFGEYLSRSQGEMLVSGRSAPLPLAADQDAAASASSLECCFPRIYEELKGIARTLELHFRDMQDIEFTVENNTLYLLQTRPAKRTDRAALKIAIDLVNEELINKAAAVARLEEVGVQQLFLPVFSPSASKQLLAKGNPASLGVGSGKLAFNRQDVIMRTQAGEDIIFVANRTTPEDISGIAASKGILTREGGMTSHAAINSRRMGKPCVTGCQVFTIDKEAGVLRTDSVVLGPNDSVSIDGYSGEVFLGVVEIIEPEYPPTGDEKNKSGIEHYVNTYLEWEKEFSGNLDHAAI